MVLRLAEDLLRSPMATILRLARLLGFGFSSPGHCPLRKTAVARPAKISAAYLQKLEAGMVKNPSPRVLHRLATVLDVSYGKLMELAGYVVPAADRATGRTTPTLAQQALLPQDLTDEEWRAVAAFIAYLREQRKKT